MDGNSAIILLSGGIDSATTAGMAKREGYQLYALSFDYGQRHKEELNSAKRVAHTLGVQKHLVLGVDLRGIGGSALTDAIDVPKGREEMGSDIPITYVPARNTIFLSLALAWGEVLGVEDIFIGVNAVDYSGYPDCRPEYIQAFEQMAHLATKAGVEGRQKLRIHTPLIHMGKKEIIQTGISLGIDYSLTHSCYDPKEGKACGRCDSCVLRKKGFLEANIPDPTCYSVP